MRRPGLIAVVVTLAGFCAPNVQSQTLDHMRRQIREPAGFASDSSSGDDPNPLPRATDANKYYDDEDKSVAEELVGNILLMGLVSPFVVPRAALQDTGADAAFPDHPYDGQDGSMTYEHKSPGAHNSLIVLQTDFGTAFDALSHGHVRASGELVSRFGIDTEFFYRHEDLTSGNDSLAHGDANLTYRFAQNEHWQFRVGAGMNWSHDAGSSDVGFNTTYGAEWFPADPWMLTSTLDLGRLGDSSLVHFRNTIGVTRNGWGIFTGHDSLRLGSLKIHSWINGIEYRF